MVLCVAVLCSPKRPSSSQESDVLLLTFSVAFKFSIL